MQMYPYVLSGPMCTPFVKTSLSAAYAVRRFLPNLVTGARLCPERAFYDCRPARASGQGLLRVQEFVRKNAATFTTSAKEAMQVNPYEENSIANFKFDKELTALLVSISFPREARQGCRC
jgi:hypothetical protein